MKDNESYWDGLLKHEGKMKTQRDMYFVQETLKRARKYGLETEVVWSALVMAVEANEHGKTMEQVLETALAEWDI